MKLELGTVIPLFAMGLAGIFAWSAMAATQETHGEVLKTTTENLRKVSEGLDQLIEYHNVERAVADALKAERARVKEAEEEGD